MSCKYYWWNLPAKIKERLNINLRYNWNRIPIELNLILGQLKAEKPSCYSQFFKPKEKIYWFTLPYQIEKLCNLIDCEPPIEYNFDLEYAGTDMFDNYGIEDEATFISFLESQGATNIIVTDFQLTPSRLRCNLTFDGITELLLSSFGINKINNLDALVNLTTLDLSDNQITTIENLDSLVNLTALYLSNNQITTIENLDSLVNLTELYLSYNQITIIENLDTLVNLTSLDLSSNQIIIIENLDTLVNLTYSDLKNNQITTIENLDSLVNLTYLALSNNQIITIENLDSLVNLTELYLYDNQITTIEFNKLNSWALLAPSNGIIYTNNNTNNFNTSTTHTTLLSKSWIITL